VIFGVYSLRICVVWQCGGLSICSKNVIFWIGVASRNSE